VTTVKLPWFTISGSFIGGILLPTLLLLWGFVQPFIDKSTAFATGVWFHRDRKWHNIAFITACVIVIALTYLGTYMRGPYWHVYWPWESWEQIPPKL
jgi:quinol-cytochrome oxidoreductase complex cytochrome b subunit